MFRAPLFQALIKGHVPCSTKGVRNARCDCFRPLNYRYFLGRNWHYCFVGHGAKIHGRQGKAFSFDIVIFVICDIDATFLT